MLEKRIGPSWVSQTGVLRFALSLARGVVLLSELTSVSRNHRVARRVEFIILIMRFAVSNSTF